MSKRGRPSTGKTETVRTSKSLADMLHEIARLEGSTVAAVADRLFRQVAEVELKRVRKLTIARWETATK